LIPRTLQNRIAVEIDSLDCGTNWTIGFPTGGRETLQANLESMHDRARGAQGNPVDLQYQPIGCSQIHLPQRQALPENVAGLACLP
jgi:hypothetical protein